MKIGDQTTKAKFSASIYLFKINNENNSPVVSGVFTFNFEQISCIILVFPLLTLNN